MANSSNNVASLPVILIVDMDNEVEEFIIYNPPSGPGSTINTTKLKEGLMVLCIFCAHVCQINSDTLKATLASEIYSDETQLCKSFVNNSNCNNKFNFHFLLF